MRRRCPRNFPVAPVVLAILGTIPLQVAAAPPPPTAFPGDTDRFAAVSGACPTFLWGAVAGADRYELAVYALDEEGRLGEHPSLRRTLPASVNGWTPEAGSCPAAGGRYAWVVRAFIDEEATDWSDGRLFELSGLPSIDEVEAALDVLRRYAGESREASAETETTGARETPQVPVPWGRRDRLAAGILERLRKRLEATSARTGSSDRKSEDDETESLKAREATLERLRQIARESDPDPVREAIRSQAFQAESVSPRTVTFPTEPSLALEGDLVIDGAVFHEDLALLHTDGGFESGNTALGLDALVSATPDVPSAGDGELNTAVGRSALRNNSSGPGNTALGAVALYSNTGGELNTAVGALTLSFNTTGDYNTAAGVGALYTNSTGSSNTAAGARALRDNTTGFNNTATGREALRDNETGVDNTAAGAFALATNFTGDFNTALGAWALSANTGGSRNTASGAFALESNTIGELNTADGYRALSNNTTGLENTAVGARALESNTSGGQNSASGYMALATNSTGYSNTATGHLALAGNTVGSRNTAVGNLALEANTTGNQNVAIGLSALRNNSTGALNTAVGAIGLRNNSTGSLNSGFGAATLYYNTTGLYNTASGGAALLYNTTGDRNTAVGAAALGRTTTGSLNTALGYGAGSDLQSGDNNIYIGNPGEQIESDTIRIGDGQTATFVAGVRGTSVGSGIQVLVGALGRLGTTTSSRRFKEEVADMGDSSAALLALRPVTFRYTEEAAGDDPRPVDFGLIAEEVAEIYPDLVAYDEEGRPYSVRYHVLPAMLLNEIQRQHDRDLAQRREIERLRDRLRALEAVQRSPPPR